MRILLVEDDPLLGDGIKTGLTESGYSVDWVEDGVTAEASAKDQSYDLLLLDIMLPGQSGIELLEKVRAAGQQVPVLLLTAKDSVADRVRGLDSGADDYLVKPFDFEELLARVRALMRRGAGHSGPVFQVGDLVLDPASHRVTRAGEVIELTPREFAILHILMQNQGRVQSRAKLEQGLYSWDMGVESNAIEVHIHHLRKKLGPGFIRTIRGVGYVVDKAE